MQLVYRTEDMQRARVIMDVLDAAGIPAELQGQQVHSLHLPGGFQSLTIWVMDDAQWPLAQQVLERFYASESRPQTSAKVSDPRTSDKALWVVLALLIGAMIAGLVFGE